MRRLFLLSLAMAALTKPCRPSTPLFSVEQPISSSKLEAPLVITARASTSSTVPPSKQYVRRQVLMLTDAARQVLRTRSVGTNARLAFALFDDVTLTATVRHVESKERTISLIAEGDNIPATITLSYGADDGMSAFIDMANDGDVSIVRYAEEPQRLLANQYPLKTPLTCGARTRELQSPPVDVAAAAAATRDRPSQISVGVMYTPKALCALVGAGPTQCPSESDLWSILETLVGDASRVLTCNTIKARVNLVGLRMLKHTETGTLKEDLEVFQDSASGPGKDVLDFRKQYEADVVFVLVADASDDDGRAEVFYGTGAEFANRATAVMRAGLVYTPNLFVHELGHTMGAGHQFSEKGRYHNSYANEFEIRKTDFHTIMWATASGARLPFFSGKDLKVLGEKTGSVFRDHVGTLDKTRDMVEQFQGGVSESLEEIVPCSASYYRITTEPDSTNP
jgi:Metallo-peptidase family M12B Reprolysin-like